MLHISAPLSIVVWGWGVGGGGPSRKVSVEVSAAKALNPDYV